MKIKSFIHSIELSLNNYCRLQCVGCSSLNPDSDKIRNLDFARVLPILQNFDLQEIVICGNNGEPLEHPDISQILLGLSESFPEINIHVSTNGENLRSLNPQIFRKNVTFQIAVDGHKSSIHELTRKNSSLDTVFQNIDFLQQHHAQLSLIYSRHRTNEQEAAATAALMLEKFGLPLYFRDTTITSEAILPPQNLSANGNVSVLYEAATAKKEYEPNKKHIYIESNGECYPCVSFTKHKTHLKPVNIYDYIDSVSFLKSFLDFQSQFCPEYQKTGDIRQCNLNCGIYRKNFRYDTIEDLKAL